MVQQPGDDVKNCLGKENKGEAKYGKTFFFFFFSPIGLVSIMLAS